MTRRSPTECPVCGATVPRGARACPECGADERSGWNEERSRYDGLDLPDEAYADDEATPSPRRRSLTSGGLAWHWWIVGVLLIVALLVMFVGRR